jgi:hypothetical protein
MIAYQVHLNGKQICIAGADDLGVLNAIVTIGGRLGSKSVRFRPPQSSDDAAEERPRPTLHVGGLTARGVEGAEEHLRWRPDVAVAIGDVVEVRIIEVSPDAADPAEVQRDSKEATERRIYERAKEQYLRLRGKFEPDSSPS